MYYSCACADATSYFLQIVDYADDQCASSPCNGTNGCDTNIQNYAVGVESQSQGSGTCMYFTVNAGGTAFSYYYEGSTACASVDMAAYGTAVAENVAGGFCSDQENGTGQMWSILDAYNFEGMTIAPTASPTGVANATWSNTSSDSGACAVDEVPNVFMSTDQDFDTESQWMAYPAHTCLDTDGTAEGMRYYDCSADGSTLTLYMSFNEANCQGSYSSLSLDVSSGPAFVSGMYYSCACADATSYFLQIVDYADDQCARCHLADPHRAMSPLYHPRHQGCYTEKKWGMLWP
jgi:hypothetical protein